MDDTIADFPDLTKLTTGPTRGSAVLDLIATNLESQSLDICTRPPLLTEDGTFSDHKIVYVSGKVANCDRFITKEIWTRPQTTEGLQLFDDWICNCDWNDILMEGDPDTKVELLVNQLQTAMDLYFSRKKIKIKKVYR